MTRACGQCTLCCKLVPVAEMAKGAGQRCQHQRLKGCAIYARRPMVCRLWDCRWLSEDDTGDLRRPDLAHYVIDALPDYVTFANNDRPEARFQQPVLQVWVDPRHREAHRDPALRAYIQRRGAEGFGAIIRFSSHEAIVLFPPSLTGREEWLENDTGVVGPDHNQADVAAVLTRVTGEEYGVGLPAKLKELLP